MERHDWLAEHFEAQRPRLRAMAYRMLGSLAEAEDAVQESWLHVSRSDTSTVKNIGGWLTTVVARVCLNMLHAREARREESLEVAVPGPIISREGEIDPQEEPAPAASHDQGWQNCRKRSGGRSGTSASVAPDGAFRLKKGNVTG